MRVSGLNYGCNSTVYINIQEALFVVLKCGIFAKSGISSKITSDNISLLNRDGKVSCF